MAEAATAFLCCPVFGYIVDISPTRRFPYLLGLIFLGASMGLLAIARSTTVFVLARLLQGGATAMVAVAGLALLTDSVPLDNLGQTIGYQGSAIALGFLLGPLLGGIIYDAAGYQNVFRMAFGLVGVDLVMRVAMVEKKVVEGWRGSDSDTASASASASAPILSSGRDEGYRTFSDQEMNGGLDGQPEQQAHEHATPANPPAESKPPAILEIAKQPRVVISSLGLLAQGILFSAFDAVRPILPFKAVLTAQTIPIFVETTFNWTPLGAGLAFLPSALTALMEPFFGTSHNPSKPTTAKDRKRLHIRQARPAPPSIHILLLAPPPTDLPIVHLDKHKSTHHRPLGPPHTHRPINEYSHASPLRRNPGRPNENAVPSFPFSFSFFKSLFPAKLPSQLHPSQKR